MPAHLVGASAHVDELHLGCEIKWAPGHDEHWAAIETAKQDAQAAQVACRFPLIPGVLDAVVHGIGTGRGRESYCAYWISCGPGGCVWVQVDPRESDGRHLYNGRIRITGRACLLLGMEAALGMARRVVAWLGGEIKDEWVKVIHVCMDLPGVEVDEFVEPFRRRQFTTTAKEWAIRDGVDGSTGYTVGKSSGRLRLNVYDKLADIATNHDGVYEQAYVDRRCGGAKPPAATRVEYQVGREWLTEHELDTPEDVLGRLADLVSKLTAAEGDEAYAFFRLTDQVPDRANKNQQRAGVLQLWACVVDEFRRRIGEPVGRLGRIVREKIKDDRATKTVVSYVTRMAAAWDRLCETGEDVVDVLRDMIARHKLEEEGYIGERWEKHAREAGTLRFVLGFDPHRYDPLGKLRRAADSLFDIGGETCYVPF